MSLDDAKKWAEEIVGYPLEIVAQEIIPASVETHQQRAERLFAAKLITQECYQTPCLPCQGRVGEKPCLCGCHKIKEEKL